MKNCLQTAEFMRNSITCMINICNPFKMRVLYIRWDEIPKGYLKWNFQKKERLK